MAHQCWFFVVLMSCVVPCWADEPESERAGPPVSFDEKLLLAIPSDHQKPVTNKGGYASSYWITVSKNGKQALYAASRNGRNFIVVGDQKGPDLDGELGVPTISPDGTVVMYAVTTTDNKRQFYVNHKRLGDDSLPIKVVAGRYLVAYSLDKSRIATVMQPPHGGREFVMINGAQKGPEFEKITDPAFSPDGKHLAYVVQHGGKQSVVVDGEKGPEFILIDLPMFSRDGKHIAYRVPGAMVVDGLAGPTVDNSDESTFSPDGNHFAYWAKQGSTRFVVVDGKRGPEVEQTGLPGAQRIAFSPDGNRHAYAAKVGSKQVVVIDGRIGGESFDEVMDVRFTPDGNRVIFGATVEGRRFIVDNGRRGPEFERVSSHFLKISDDNATIAYWAAEKSKSYMIVNGRKSEDVNGLVGFSPVISPDSTKVAYTVSPTRPGEGKGFVVVNGIPGADFDSVGVPVFSPDSRTVAYSARHGEKESVVLNGRPGPEFDSVGSLTFTPDSRKVAYRANVGQEVWWKVLDVPGP